MFLKYFVQFYCFNFTKIQKSMAPVVIYYVRMCMTFSVYYNF